MNMLIVPESPESRKIRALDAASNVIPFPNVTGDSFGNLTARLVIERFRAGTLPEAVVVALMASAGLRP
jgi:hypothetical protein